MSKTVKINFTLNNQSFKKVLQISKTEVEDGGIVTVFDVEEFKEQIKKIQISGDVNCDEFCKIITESFNVTVNKRAYISECEVEIEVEVVEVKEVKKEVKVEEMEEIEVNGIHCIEKELEKEIEDNKIAYHNENSNWYLINDNYKDAETIEEEEIDLTKYQIVKIESSETGNNEVDEGFWVWEAENGVFYLEEEGYFMKFESLEKLIRQYNYEKVLREEEVEYYDFNASVNYDEFN